jgi:hypothetical protein
MKTAADGVHGDDDSSGHDMGGLHHRRLVSIRDMSHIPETGSPNRRSDRLRPARNAYEIRNIYRSSGMRVIGYIMWGDQIGLNRPVCGEFSMFLIVHPWQAKI